jgi:hypothetical protein
MDVDSDGNMVLGGYSNSNIMFSSSLYPSSCSTRSLLVYIPYLDGGTNWYKQVYPWDKSFCSTGIVSVAINQGKNLIGTIMNYERYTVTVF